MSVREHRLRLGRPANLGRRVRVATELDLADVQGNVLRGYTFPVAAYLFLRIDDVERGRALLRRMLSEVTTAEPWEGEGPAKPRRSPQARSECVAVR